MPPFYSHCFLSPDRTRALNLNLNTVHLPSFFFSYPQRHRPTTPSPAPLKTSGPPPRACPSPTQAPTLCCSRPAPTRPLGVLGVKSVGLWWRVHGRLWYRREALCWRCMWARRHVLDYANDAACFLLASGVFRADPQVEFDIFSASK